MKNNRLKSVCVFANKDKKGKSYFTLQVVDTEGNVYRFNCGYNPNVKTFEKKDKSNGRNND